MHVYPKRTLLLPPSLLLPKDLPLRATLRVGVRGPLETGEVGGLFFVGGVWRRRRRTLLPVPLSQPPH